MSSHFFVIKLKDVIKTLIIAAAAIVVLVVALNALAPSFKSSKNLYIPGTYRTALALGKASASVDVTVDERKIKAVELTEAGSDTEYFYPLLRSTAAFLEDEIVKNQSLTVAVPENASVTAGVILQAVEEALEEAAVR